MRDSMGFSCNEGQHSGTVAIVILNNVGYRVSLIQSALEFLLQSKHPRKTEGTGEYTGTVDTLGPPVLIKDDDPLVFTQFGLVDWI